MLTKTVFDCRTRKKLSEDACLHALLAKTVFDCSRAQVQARLRLALYAVEDSFLLRMLFNLLFAGGFSAHNRLHPRGVKLRLAPICVKSVLLLLHIRRLGIAETEHVRII